MNYTDFLKSKVVVAPKSGFAIDRGQLNPELKGHQKDAVQWAIAGGRRALFESFGLGKTAQEIEFCHQVVMHERVNDNPNAKALIVLPLGVCAAVYLTEYAANKKVVAVIEYAAETLSGIPSIIYGLVGMMFFCQFLGMKKSILAGALTLVIMNLPTIMRTTQESLKTVPQSYREGAFGLGAGKWRTIRTVVLPGCVDGVVTGCILSVGRILGETAALLYTAGFGLELVGFVKALHTSSATLTVALYVYATEGGETALAFSIAAILMVLTLLINLSASLVGRKLRKK